jgi:hypothetical protein
MSLSRIAENGESQAQAEQIDFIIDLGGFSSNHTDLGTPSGRQVAWQQCLWQTQKIDEPDSDGITRNPNGGLQVHRRTKFDHKHCRHRSPA